MGINPISNVGALYAAASCGAGVPQMGQSRQTVGDISEGISDRREQVQHHRPSSPPGPGTGATIDFLA